MKDDRVLDYYEPSPRWPWIERIPWQATIFIVVAGAVTLLCVLTYLATLND